MTSLAADVRAFAMRPAKSLQRDPNGMRCLEFCLIESFETPWDWETMSLWSIEWRTFALFVAEAIEGEQ